MIIFIIYLLILTQALNASFEPISTENFIKPATNLKEKQEETPFIGFEGSPGKYKKAQMYIINEKGELQEKENFSFNLSPSELSTFFSAHTGSFTEPKKEELAILVSNPTTGTKIYLWEITESGEFKRTYKEPTTINQEHPSSLPIEAVTTSQNQNQNDITISFGSPNRNIVVLSFQKDKINIKNNLATDFLQNQAGTIYIRDFLPPKTKEPALYVFNAGNPKESVIIDKEPTTKKSYNFEGFINDVYIYTNNQEIKETFLISGTALYFPSTNQKIELPPSEKYIKIVLEKNKLFWLLNDKGFIEEFNVNLKENKAERKSGFFSTKADNQELYYSEERPTKKENVEFLYSKDKILIATQTAKQNTITLFAFEQKKEKEKQQEKADTLVIITKTEKTIPILLNENLNFIKLITIEQPAEMELNLTNMSYIWKPSSKDAGFHNLEYNIIYNKPGKITKETNKEGKTNLNKAAQETNISKRLKIFVNDPPKIETDSTFSVLSGHELKIPIKTSDENKKQTIQITFLPPKTGAEINGNTFIWEPGKEHQGTHQIEFIANDGFSSNSSHTNVLVDTTIQTTKLLHDFVLTVNKEFTLELQEEKKYSKYNKNSGPENTWISKTGKLHWIPIETQLGYNEINIERIGKNTQDNIIISTFVNSPPIISHRPDNIEYINIGEEFVFNLRAFDANVDQNMFWLLNARPEGMILNEENQLFYTGQSLDYNTYIIEATDSIDTDVFYGQIYVNDVAKITSSPPEVIQLGEELNYSIEVEDKNKQNPNKKEKTNTFIYSIIKGPQKLKLINNRLKWKPTKEDTGNHDFQIHVTNGLDELEHEFQLYVNEAPKIISTNKLKIMVGDTLTHLITANDQTNKNELTFSIRTTIEDMYLNASTGKIHWIPGEDDIGTHTVEVAVSDGFEKSDDIQEIEIIVQGYPQFLSTPPTEAYVGLEYRYYIEAQNAQEQKTPGQDFFVEIEETTFSNMELDTAKYIILSTPKLEDAGRQNIKLKLSDNENNQIIKTFEVLVIETSPCETDTLITKEEINKKPEIKLNQKKPQNSKPPLFKIP